MRTRFSSAVVVGDCVGSGVLETCDERESVAGVSSMKESEIMLV